MVFSSSIFLWLFLPVVLVLYYLAQERWRNVLLLAASLFFYAWGEPVYILLMVVSILINYMFGCIMERTEGGTKKKFWLITAVVLNLGMLGVFKYAGFAVESINSIAGTEVLPHVEIALPIGISFYTFQALSYVIDVYRREVKGQKNLISLALYISFFPQLIAGPIVKYHDINEQLGSRQCTAEKFYKGVQRFIWGLGKKMIFANTLAGAADMIFGLTTAELGFGTAWAGIICYSLQIYYDFSGYSDMAIGLGKMFGFEFKENFNYPYVSKSIREFWRRWHISLSTWFKEYLYIPLGGSRKGNGRTYINLFIVFFCTGLWHGASWNFVIWGMFHGVLLVIERLFLGRLLDKNPVKIVNHIYVILMVIVGWVFFRAEDLSYALGYLQAMVSFGKETFLGAGVFVTPYILTCIAGAVLMSGVLRGRIERFVRTHINQKVIDVSEVILCVFILGTAAVMLGSGAYNPFIYFRF